MIGISIANSLGLNKLSGINPDAAAFIAAAGITGTTEVNAVNALVNGLQTDGLWSKMKAVYPFVTDNRNLLSYTEDFSNAAWQKVGATVTANDILAPNGTMTADKVVFSGASKTIYQGFTASGTATRSIYVKGTAGETISLDDTAVSQPPVTLTGDWQRITFTGGTPNYFGISTFYGATARTIWLWGAQTELGSTATTYQPIATTQQAFISSQFKYNLVNPVDSDAAFRLVFNGGWTHSSTGATPNGTNGYANTYLNPTTALTNYNAHASTYNRTNNNNTGWDLGLSASTGGYVNEFLLAGRNTNSSISGFYDFNGSLNGAASVASATSLGFFNNSVISNTSQKLYKNGTQIAVNTNTNTSVPANGNVFISAVNDASLSLAIAFDSSQKSFATIGNGLTDTEAANLYTRVQTFNQALSRQVGVPIVSDADAQAFLNSAEITDVTQANAINTLVTDLKAQGIWTKMKAIYPFVGGTATTHKWNLKDPRDLDAAYRLVFNGGWTHSSTGALPNGTNAYADTFLIPSSVLTQNSNHLSYYSRTASAASTGGEIGSVRTIAPLQYFHSHLRFTGDIYYMLLASNTTPTVTNTNSQGFFNGSRTNSTSIAHFKNGTNLSNASSPSVALNSLKVFIGSLNIDGGAFSFSNKQVALASIGDGLTDTEATALYNSVNNYQVALSRNV